MKATVIVLLCVGAAIGYGILHDEVTARICVEYFTVGHPDLFGTDSPTLLGIGWGIVATWWAGLLLGIPLAGHPSRYGGSAGAAPQTDCAGFGSPRRPVVACHGLRGGCCRFGRLCCSASALGLSSRGDGISGFGLTAASIFGCALDAYGELCCWLSRRSLPFPPNMAAASVSRLTAHTMVLNFRAVSG